MAPEKRRNIARGLSLIVIIAGFMVIIGWIFDKAQVVLSITSLAIILLMGLLFFSAVFKVHTGAEELFIKGTIANEKNVVAGRPSLPAIFNFILIGGAGILTISNSDKVRLKPKIIGYVIDAPLLYYCIEGKNSTIAFHTAALFVLLGTGLLCL